MICFNNIYWCLFSFITFKGLEAAKIYVLDLPNEEDDMALMKNYDDYDLITEFEYDDRNKRQIVFKTTKQDPNNLLKGSKHKSVHDAVCQRLFGNMFGNKNQYFRCLKAIKSHKRSYENPYHFQPKSKIKYPISYTVKVVRKKNIPPFTDMTRFSQDYLDVNDLGRSRAFATDYVDVDDFRIARNLRESRKSGLAIEEINDSFVNRGKGTDDDSFEESASEEKKHRQKLKRYKVISNEDVQSSDENDRIGSDSLENSNAIEDNTAESDIQSSDSIEFTTKRPKSKVKTGGNGDKYVYLQGNKYFDKDDFRRRMRLPYFFPNRHHWDDEHYKRLGYFWFNGIKGKYSQ